MASLTAKRIHGRTYYYLRECQRVDGRPKIVRQVYLGSAEEVAAALGKSPTGLRVRSEVPVLEFGAVAALYDLVQRLDVVALIDRHVPQRRGRGPSVGVYLVLAALNRCVAPKSKAQMAAWFNSTALPRWFPVKGNQLTSQRFWDQMSRVSEEALLAIGRELSDRVVRDFGLDRRALFYDATNFFTYIDSFNAKPTLAQRGHSKEGRANLRILGLALLVSADHQIPLLYHLYAGNQPDAPTFRSLIGELVERYRLLAQGVEDITLVFDKGNNAKDTIASLGETPYHYVGSLVPTQHPDLLALPKDRFRRLEERVFADEVLVYRTEKTVFGRRQTVVVTFNPNLFEAQTRTLEREAAKCEGRLADYARYLDGWKSGKGTGPRPTLSASQKAVALRLRGRHMKDLLHIEWEGAGEPDGLPRLRHRFDGDAYARLKDTLLGKTLIFTDRADWSDEQIVTAYRGQHYVEGAFRQMKDVRYLSFRPVHHWTDQKIRVHAFYCVLALTLCALLRRELAHRGIPLSVDAMLDGLTSIKEVHVLFSSGAGRPRVKKAHSELEPLAQKLYDTLGIERFLGS